MPFYKALVSFASNNVAPAGGQIFEADAEQADDWLRAGLVEPAAELTETPIEFAAHAGAPETATGKRQRRGKTATPPAGSITAGAPEDEDDN